jgi:hypothetical protein
MKFMLFVCVDRERYDRKLAQPPGDPNAPMPWADDLDAAGIRLDGDELSPYTNATTVRVRGGEVVLGDGPFAETREVIAGYDIIECADLDTAVKIAASHPAALNGTIEIRPFRGWS